jgi:transcriptional regulator with XRE-family HTH domain
MQKTVNPVDRHLGARIRMQRLALGISQESLGKAIGLTFQQVQKYEKGVNRVSGSRMHQIAMALKVSPSFFFEAAPAAVGNAKATSFIEEFVASKQGVALARAFTKINDSRMRGDIVALVERIAGTS